MINEVTRDLFSRGQEVFDKTVQSVEVGEEYRQKELLGYSFMVTNPKDVEEMLRWANKNFQKRHLNSEHGQEWFQNMISGKGLNPNSAEKYMIEYWNKFGKEKDGRFSYTYSERMVYLPQVIEALRNNLYRRGAVITIYNTVQDITNMGKRRVPCSMYYQFLVRDNLLKGPQLNLIYTSRSCDFTNFFPLDIYRSVRLLEHVTKELKIQRGPLIVFIGSLHAYYCEIPEERRW